MGKECRFPECTTGPDASVSSPTERLAQPQPHTVEVCAEHIWWGLSLVGAPGMTLTVRLFRQPALHIPGLTREIREVC